jgi:hypothetical protein
MTASSFETRLPARQDEEPLILTVRSVAQQRISNHGAAMMTIEDEA